MDRSQRLIGADCLGVDNRVLGPDCLVVNHRSIQSGVDDFSALSWESVEVMFVLTRNGGSYL